MTTTKTTVTGQIVTSNNTPISSGKVKFVLSSFSLDTAQREIVLARKSTADIATDGTFSVDLWPNEEGLAETQYVVSTETTTGGDKFSTALGSIQVPDVASIDLFDMLEAITVAASTRITVVDDENAFDAATPSGDELVVLYV